MNTRSWTFALRGEWYKLISLRSTWWTLAATLVVAVGMAYLQGWLLRDYTPPPGARPLDPFFPGSLGLVLALPALAGFGIVSTAGEYSARTLSSSLLAVPNRNGFYLAKVVAAAGLSVVTVLVAVPLAHLACQAGLGDDGVRLTSQDALTVLAGSAIFMVSMAVFAIGVGAVARNSAVALGVMLPLLFLSSQGLGNIPAIQDYAQYLPDQGGQVIMRIVPADDPAFAKDYGPWQGLGLTGTWAAALLAAGWWVTRRAEP